MIQEALIAKPGADQSGPEERPPAGQWPVEVPKSGVIITGLLWAMWVAFLVWMVFVRLDATPLATSGGG